MTSDIHGKVALVTGGSKGIGLACARQLSALGARIAICSRSRDNVDNALIDLPDAIGFVADLTSSEQSLEMVEDVYGHFDKIDILINSAGAAKRAPADELDPAIWRAAMDAEYFSYINVIDPVIKRMA